MKKNDYVTVDKGSIEDLADSLAYLNNKTLNNTNKLIKELGSANLEHKKIRRINLILIISASITFVALGFFLGLYKGTDFIKRYILDDKIFINKQLQDEIELYKFKTANLDQKYKDSISLAKILRKNGMSLYYQDGETYLLFPKNIIENKIHLGTDKKTYYIMFTSDFNGPFSRNLFFPPEQSQFSSSMYTRGPQNYSILSNR